MASREAAREFEDLIEEVEEKLHEMEVLLRHEAPEITRKRAGSYWIAHIRGALRKESGYLGGSMFTAEDSLQELREAAGMPAG